MFCPIELSLSAGKQTALRQSKRVFLDTERDTASRWQALEFIAYNLTNGGVSVTDSNPRVLVGKHGDEAANLGYDLWVCDRLLAQIKRARV